MQIGRTFGTEHNFLDAPRKAWEYILSQQCIDKSIFRSDDNQLMGVGCSCSSTETTLTDRSNYLCYFVTARSVKAKTVYENIPDDQTILAPGDDCRDECPYFWDDPRSTGLDTWVCSDEDDVIDEHGWCKECDELENRCTICDQSAGCTECEMKFGEFEGHDYPAVVVSTSEGKCHNMDCSTKLDDTPAGRMQCSACHESLWFYDFNPA